MADSPFRGLYTAIYRVPDLAAATEWYTRMFGVEPYFNEPYYVGFDIGGYELGLDPSEGEVADSGSVVAYWGVGDAEAVVSALIEKGARVHSPVRDVGGGIKVATILDPFGNHIGILENPHFGVKHP